MSKGMWKAMKAKARKIRIAKTKKRREEAESRKEERKEKRKEKT